jgi:1-aminocyclopropane-1-carboxylate deaminase/D-cysteine desulfhydrase-like pyridoxal-dependent ACC family enzyme
MSNHLSRAFPLLASRLPYLSLADLPTPVSMRQLAGGSTRHEITIKHDDVTAEDYGGNKLRKLEYLLQQASIKRAKRIATFGTVGSHHAIATALYAKRAGFECTCFLSHQSMQPGLGNALRFHLQNETEIIRFGGDRKKRIATLRKHLQGRNAWVVPLGGSSWYGTVGYVNAALELAEQIRAGELPCPSRLYIALGTMGTAAGLALGFALSDIDIEIHAICITLERYANEPALDRLMNKTATMLNSIDPGIPANLASRTNLRFRKEFLGDGYGRTNDVTERAIEIARDDLDLSLECTYSGKAMAALMHDLDEGVDDPVLFWNTFSSRPMMVDESIEPDFERVPKEFARYFD